MPAGSHLGIQLSWCSPARQLHHNPLSPSEKEQMVQVASPAFTGSFFPRISFIPLQGGAAGLMRKDNLEIR